ncbi:L-lysine 6-transaminase [Rhodothermus profundi]|uniref:L-lysine-epsilon aminotransferase n=1 Tax=Rhodothermus profundi TaxID=633813 RepID=A0A1M6QA45_9BACT|nr:L-lysine 6-transaminase [Rhodothermus profundi]SHK17028.1 L-lysine 6-transaminase precursor [Rhodothermus profundi]
MEHLTTQQITPEMVRPVLSRHLLTDGLPLVLDMERSQGVRLYDQLTGREFVDFFGFFASSAVGMNHPKMLADEDFKKRLLEAALNKVTNSDIYTVHMARFVQTFERVGIPDYLPYAFFIDGGALAVENALKAAFDWKVRKNFQKGYRREVGHRVLHFDQAFHGRSGYTLSLTNTFDPRKTQYFPKFDWPRVINPKLTFPLTEENLERTIRLEQLAIRQAKQYFYEYKDEIACIIIEPIQAEGGDNHFRPEFLQALRELADENDALLIFDEVQTGVGITGAFWAHQALGVQPDIIAFGKKTQVCGILAGRRLDEVEDNVFHVSSRLNSTWGGNLADMVRFDRILEIIEEDHLVENAARAGAHLLRRLEEMARELPFMTNVRGRGLMCAFDLPTPAFRDAVRQRSLEEGVLILACGERSIRFRPPLIITEAEIDEGLQRLRRALEHVARQQSAS